MHLHLPGVGMRFHWETVDLCGATGGYRLPKRPQGTDALKMTQVSICLCFLASSKWKRRIWRMRLAAQAKEGTANLPDEPDRHHSIPGLRRQWRVGRQANIYRRA
jgi:hypothetical protein